MGVRDWLARAMTQATCEFSDAGRPTYAGHGKMFCFHRGPRDDASDPETGERMEDVFAFRVADLDVKELILADDRGIFFTTPHWNGYAAVLLRIPSLGRGDRDEPEELVVAAWRTPGFFLTGCRFPRPNRVAAAVPLHLFPRLTVFVTERYRLVAVPGLFLFAAIGIWELWSTLVTGGYHRIALYLGLLAASTWFVSLPQREPSLWALDSYNSGLRAQQTNNLVSAERTFDFAYAYSPQNAELNFALGNLRLAQGNVPAAKRFYLGTLRLDSAHSGAWNNLGLIALQEEHWKIAAAYFERALEGNQSDGKVFYLLAEAQFRAGNLLAADTAIGRALALNPSQPEFHTLADRIGIASHLPPLP